MYWGRNLGVNTGEQNHGESREVFNSFTTFRFHTEVYCPSICYHGIIHTFATRETVTREYLAIACANQAVTFRQHIQPYHKKMRKVPKKQYLAPNPSLTKPQLKTCWSFQENNTSASHQQRHFAIDVYHLEPHANLTSPMPRLNEGSLPPLCIPAAERSQSRRALLNAGGIIT